MKIYKIGRYYYNEITEDEYLKIDNDIYLNEIPWKDWNIYCLADRDGEPIKFFKRVKINGKKS